MKDIMQKLSELEATAPKVSKKKMLKEDSTTPPMNVSDKPASLKDVFESIAGQRPIPVVGKEGGAQTTGAGFVNVTDPALQGLGKTIGDLAAQKKIQLVVPTQPGQAPQAGQTQQSGTTPAPAGATGQPQAGQQPMREKWGTDTKVAPSEKGKYAGKDKAELTKAYNKLKASGPHKKGSPEFGKMRELAFAIRAKSGWGKVQEEQLDELSPETIKSAQAKRYGQLNQLAQTGAARAGSTTSFNAKASPQTINQFHDTETKAINRDFNDQQRTSAKYDPAERDAALASNERSRGRNMSRGNMLNLANKKLQGTANVPAKSVAEGAKQGKLEEGSSAATFKKIDNFDVWHDSYLMRVSDDYDETEIDGKLVGVAQARGGVYGLWYNKARFGTFSQTPFKSAVAYAESDPNYPYANDYDDDLYEGAKVDRMVKHIEKSERKLGKSKEKASDIAWATANKRGMLDNKNKKKVKEGDIAPTNGIDTKGAGLGAGRSMTTLEAKEPQVEVIDNAFNRENYKDLIGKKYPKSKAPAYARVKEISEGAKPDFLDLDKDGNKKESMKKAAADKKKKKVDESMNHRISAARLEGKSHGLRGHAHSGKRYEDLAELRAYHEGYKEGLDECYGQGVYETAPAMPPATVGGMANAAMPTMEDDVEEGNAFTAALAKTPKGGKFSVGGKTFTDRSSYDSKIDEYAFEAWDRELSNLLNEGTEVNEGLSVSVSKGQQNSPDSVTITAQDAEADQLLQLVKHAGLGLFGDEAAHEPSSAMSLQPASGAPDEVGAGGVDIDVVDGSDGMLSLMKKLGGVEAAGAEDYADEEGAEDCGCEEETNEETCNECGGMMEAGHSCGGKEMVDEVESEDQMEYEVAEDNAPDSGAADSVADEDAEAAEDSALAKSDMQNKTNTVNEDGDEASEEGAESKEGETDEEGETVSESFTNLFKKLAFIAEESTEKEDEKAEKAGKKVTKDIEYDDKKDKKEKVKESQLDEIFGFSKQEKAVKSAQSAMKELPMIARDLGAGEVSPDQQGVMQFKIDLNNGATADFYANPNKPTAHITFSRESKHKPGQSVMLDLTDPLLPRKLQAEVAAARKANYGSGQAAQPGQAPVNEWANQAGKGPGKGTDASFEQDIEFMTKVIAGGLNKPKSTGQTTIPVIAGQEDRMHDNPQDWATLAGIKK